MLHVEKDKKGGLASTHKKSLEAVKDLSLDLIDAWRVLHPDLLQFAWRQRKAEIQCKLDFFRVSQSTRVHHRVATTSFPQNFGKVLNLLN